MLLVASSLVVRMVLLGRDVRELALAINDDNVIVEGLVNHGLNRLALLVVAFAYDRSVRVRVLPLYLV